MGFNPIGIGNVPEDGQGDGLRTAMGKVNAMFREMFYFTFRKDGALVQRLASDVPASVTDLQQWRADDMVKGWGDAEKTRWVEGIVLIPEGFVWPLGIDTTDGNGERYFLITNEIIR